MACFLGVLQSVKNWRYGDGGWVKLLNASLRDNDLDWESGPRTRETRGAMGFDPGLAHATPIAEAPFADDFESLTDAWTASGGVTRLAKRRNDLVLSLQRGAGAASKALDWRLLESGARYVAVFEIGGRDLRTAEISLFSENREIATPLELPAASDRYSLVQIELEPGNYTELRISAEPGSNSARLRLHRYAVYALPKERKS